MEVPEGHGGAQLAVDDIFVVVGGVGVVGGIFIFITFGISLVLALASEIDDGDVERAELWDGLDAGADDDKLDLGEDEAVATAGVAHVVVQVGESEEILDFAVGCLGAHAGVPAVEGLDQPDDARRTEHAHGVVLVAGHEQWG